MSFEARARLPGLHRGSGLTDREVAAATGLRLTHRREISKNPCTPGQLRTAEAAGGPALISMALWDAARSFAPGTPGGIAARCRGGPTRWRRC
jgi:hypothetical protein